MSNVNLHTKGIRTEFQVTNTNSTGSIQSQTTQNTQTENNLLNIIDPKTSDNILPKSSMSTETAYTVLANCVPPSLGAGLLSLITEMSAEQRQMTRDQKAMQTEAQIKNIQDQADKMREKAIVQLCLGIVSGTISIAQGVMTTAMTAKGMNTIKNAYDEQGNLNPNFANLDLPTTRSGAETLLNTKVQGLSSGIGGVANIMGSITQTVGGFYDAEITEMQAEQERMKAMQDSLESLEQSFKDLIQKALSTQNAIQENINQTRTKILG